MSLRRVLNLGAGTQSSVLAFWCDRGELPPVEVMLFADTGWEPKAVYDHLAWLETQIKTPIVRVSNGNLRNDVIRSVVGGARNGGERWVSIPLTVVNDKAVVRGPGETLWGQDDSTVIVNLAEPNKGMIRRQCTSEYKIKPCTDWISKNIIGRERGQRWPTTPVVERVYGISFDERQRMRDAAAIGEKWAVNSYPLVDMRLNRDQVIAAAEKMFPGRTFPRSSCIGCPFHSNAEWRAVRANPEEWADTIKVDETIRNQAGLLGKAYLHKDGVPLSEAKIDEDESQPHLEGLINEREGMCGL